MNSLLKKAIEKRRNPEKYNFEEMQRELEKERMNSLKEMLSLTPIISYLKDVIDSLASSHEDTLTETAANAVLDVLSTCESEKESINSFIKTKEKEERAHFASIEDNITTLSSLFGKEKESIIATTKENLRRLEDKTNEELQRIFSDASKFRGEQGIQGKKGDKGDKGDSVTKEEVLAELTPEIANIRQEIKRVASAKKEGGGGGGMGNVQHETKAVSSATTSVNTTYNIGGGGYALWAYYQGQLIMRGVHYTVSGKTISLLFTPDDNTNIDIIYIR